MEEIKFRAWDIQKKRMIGDIQKAYDGMEDGCLNGEHYNYVSCFDDFLKDKNFVVMQYIRLKDKNKKEIYQGDILHLTGKDSFGEYNWKAVVGFGNLHDLSMWIEAEEIGIYCEIIGNIYENPELLKEVEAR